MSALSTIVAIGARANQETSYSHTLVPRTILFSTMPTGGSRYNTNTLCQVCFSIRFAGEKKHTISIAEYRS